MNKLTNIQFELNAPKNQKNNFGNYNYRSCEDICEALKPLLQKYECFINLTDKIVYIGNRYYIEATATLYDNEGKQIASAVGYAREEEVKKGMDASQVTGSASSYARKYALNGLFAIDDNKDADTNQYQQQTQQATYQKKSTSKPQQQANPNILTKEEFDVIRADENLSKLMLQQLGTHKWKEYGEADQEVITKNMRNFMREIKGE